MKIVLCALTGFGNGVVAALAEAGYRPHLLVTRPESGPFPHYPLPNISEEAMRHDVPVLFGQEGEAAIAQLAPDLLLCATYHRLLSTALLGRAGHAVNLHPSLLPRYRGPNPFYWVLRNGERATGVTAHRLTALVDSGDIYWSGTLNIAPCETQGTLRCRLAVLACEGALAVVEAIAANTLHGQPQDETQASWQSKPGFSERIVDPRQLLELVERQICALCPFPGALVVGYHVTAVVERSRVTAVPGTLVRETDDTLLVAAIDGTLRLRLAT